MPVWNLHAAACWGGAIGSGALAVLWPGKPLCLTCLFMCRWWHFSISSCSIDFIIALISLHLCGLLAPSLSFLLCVISPSGTSQSAALPSSALMSFLASAPSDVSLSIMKSNNPKSHSFFKREIILITEMGSSAGGALRWSRSSQLAARSWKEEPPCAAH